MNRMIVLFAVFATACAAPVSHTPLALPAGWGGALPAAGWAGALPAAGWGGALPAAGYAGYAGLAAAPLAAPVAVAPVAAPAISLPAPYTTSHVAGPDAVSVHQPPPVVTKKLQYADRPYVAAYDTTVIKPIIGDIDIAVPTALLGTVSHNAPITRVSKEPFIVNEPVPVQRPYDVPYEVLKHETRVVHVPTPVHVDAPYNVPVPTPVQGEPIIQRVVGPPIVRHSHEHVSAPAVHTGAIHAGGFAGIRGFAAPAAGIHGFAAPAGWAAPAAIAH